MEGNAAQHWLMPPHLSGKQSPAGQHRQHRLQTATHWPHDLVLEAIEVHHYSCCQSYQWEQISRPELTYTPPMPHSQLNHSALKLRSVQHYSACRRNL